jgi:putative heme iron utilization protein
MADIITEKVSDRICTHMNDDHADAVLIYAQTYGETPEATSAKMLSIDPLGMNLTAQVDNRAVPVRIIFDRTLKDSEDAHHTLIDMLKKARQTQSA